MFRIHPYLVGFRNKRFLYTLVRANYNELNIETMKRKIIRILTFLILSISISTQAQWIELDSLESPIVHITSLDGRLYVCTATNGIYISSDNGNSFQISNNGLDNLNTREILALDSLLILGTNNSIYKSMDQGESWVLSSNGFPSSDSNVEDIIKKGDSIFVATYGNGILCSIDFCESWFPLNNGFSDLYRSCLVVVGTRIFTGTQYGGSGIYISDNGGLSWEQKNEGVPLNLYNPNKYVDIQSFTNVNETIFASTFGGNVLQSIDYGESWTSLNCPNNYVWKVKNIENTIFCGHNGVGISKSSDLGNSWEIINEGLITNFDKDIRTFCKLGEYIYTGSWSRKVFRRPVSEVITHTSEQKTETDLIIYPNPITDKSIIDIPYNEGEYFIIEIYNETGYCEKKEYCSFRKQMIIRKNDFKSGIHFIRVLYPNKKTLIGKFIVL